MLPAHLNILIKLKNKNKEGKDAFRLVLHLITVKKQRILSLAWKLNFYLIGH